MGNSVFPSCSRSQARLCDVRDADFALPVGTCPSLYQRRLEQLIREAIDSPPEVSIEETLRNCIDFCYGGGPDWAPSVRVSVYADNISEHQSNVPVYSTLLCTWGVRDFPDIEVKCKAVPATDVQRGRATRSPFWSRCAMVADRDGSVTYCKLGHQILHWFMLLESDDPRKQLLVNMLLQLHEACYNCIGRHKEVFEYCIYDLLDSEQTGKGPPSSLSIDNDGSQALSEASVVVRQYASMFLDKHKRHALQASVLSPLKFIHKNQYEVFENIDSHGASFWGSVFVTAFFPGLELPLESLGDLDTGWTWGAIDFLPLMQRDSCMKEALERFLAPENIGRDWRSVTAGLRLPRNINPQRLPGLPLLGRFTAVIAESRRPRSTLHRALLPYAQRFAKAMEQPALLRHCTLTAVSSAMWDAKLGPAFATLSREALRNDISASDLRMALLGDVSDAQRIQVDTELFSKLLRVAGVSWA